MLANYFFLKVLYCSYLSNQNNLIVLVKIMINVRLIFQNIFKLKNKKHRVSSLKEINITRNCITFNVL